MCECARRVAHAIDAVWQWKVAEIFYIILLVGSYVMAKNWERKAVSNGLDFSYDVAVLLKMVFNGECFAIAEPVENSFVVDVGLYFGDG